MVLGSCLESADQMNQHKGWWINRIKNWVHQCEHSCDVHLRSLKWAKCLNPTKCRLFVASTCDDWCFVHASCSWLLMYATHASVGRLLSHMSPFRKSRCAESGDTNTCNKIILHSDLRPFPFVSSHDSITNHELRWKLLWFLRWCFPIEVSLLACRAHDDYSAKIPTYRNIQIHHLKCISWVVSCFNSNLITLSATQRGSGKVGTIF